MADYSAMVGGPADRSVIAAAGTDPSRYGGMHPVCLPHSRLSYSVAIIRAAIKHVQQQPVVAHPAVTPEAIAPLPSIVICSIKVTGAGRRHNADG